MKMTRQFCDPTLAITWGIVGGTGFKGAIAAFGACYGALWLFGFIIALIWTLGKIK